MTIKGSMSAEDQRNWFGLIYDGEKAYQGDEYGRLHDDTGNIWYKDSSGETKYLGQVPQFARGSTGKGGAEKSSSVGGSDEDGVGLFGEQTEGHHTSPNNLLQRAHDERHGGADNHNNGFNSINDLAATLNYLRAEEPAPVATAMDVPEVVEQEPVPKEPIEGVDYMTPEMSDAYDRIQAYTNATHEFTAGDQIARTSEPDYDTAQAAQGLADKYKFEIAQNLQPSAQSVVNALTTAIPGKLGVYS